MQSPPTDPIDEEPRDAAQPAPPLDRSFRFSFGIYNQTTPWNDVRSLTWAEISTMLTTHEIGRKTGSCIVPAVFASSRRHKDDACQIDVVMLDSDSGATLEEIRSGIAKYGWAAVISSTHSHLTTRTVVKRSHWEKFVSSKGAEATPETYLLAKGYLARVTQGARVVEETDDHIVIEHESCPKFRIAIPLRRLALVVQVQR